MKINVLPLQSILDLAIQYTGTAENAFDLALANNRSITEALEAGDWLIANSQELKANKDILGYYQAKKLQPATAINEDYSTDNSLQGIDYWTVKIDFVVS